MIIEHLKQSCIIKLYTLSRKPLLAAEKDIFEFGATGLVSGKPTTSVSDVFVN